MFALIPPRRPALLRSKALRNSASTRPTLQQGKVELIWNAVRRAAPDAARRVLRVWSAFRSWLDRPRCGVDQSLGTEVGRADRRRSLSIR